MQHDAQTECVQARYTLTNAYSTYKRVFCSVGVYGEEGTPDPIPNSEVKLLSAEGTTP